MTRQELLATAKPILFNADMVRAILDGKKTVTRRLVYPSCQVGDILYVRESGLIQSMKTFGNKVKMLFKVDDSLIEFAVSKKEYNRLSKWAYLKKWLSPYWLTKETARIFLRVTSVNVEKLQDITEEQVIKEGIEPITQCNGCKATFGCDLCIYEGRTIMSDFEYLWNSTIKKTDLDKYCWKANPYVGVIEFERINYDEI